MPRKLLAPMAKRNYQQRNEGVRLLPVRPNCCHYFENLDFLRKSLGHYLFFYFMQLCQGRAVTYPKVLFSRWQRLSEFIAVCSTPHSRFCTHRGALYENVLSVKLPLIVPCSIVVYYLAQKKGTTRHEDNQLFQSLVSLIQVYAILFSKTC